MLPSCIGSLMVAPFAWPDESAHNLWIALLPFITLHHLFRYVFSLFVINVVLIIASN